MNLVATLLAVDSAVGTYFSSPLLAEFDVGSNHEDMTRSR
jgi:hypothetical protein